MTELVDGEVHSARCELAQRRRAGLSGGECYCPTPAERSEQRKYERWLGAEWEDGDG